MGNFKKFATALLLGALVFITACEGCSDNNPTAPDKVESK